MKQFYTIICLFIFIVLTPLAAQVKSPKTSPKVFYTETFNWGNPADPKGWTAPSGYYLEDPNDTGFNWHWWPNDSLISSWTAEPPFQSTSKADGHLCLFGALYNNYRTLYDVTPVNNSIVFPSIDCSNHASVILQFETNFSNSGLEGYGAGNWHNTIEVSPDNGMHWTQFNAGFGCFGKYRPNDVAPGQVAIFRENISEVAAGQSMVKIRINWYNYFGLYFWIIDDFQLSEALPNDLRLDKVDFQWNDQNGTIESVSYMMPFSQLGKGHNFYGFISHVSNTGATEATNLAFEVNIKHDEVAVFHDATSLPSLMPGYKDSLILHGQYEPKEKGTYSIQFKWKQDQLDDFPADNERTFIYKVSDSIYNRAGDQPDYVYSGGSGFYQRDEWALYANINHFVGSVFPIYSDCEIDGLSAYIMGGLADGLIDFGYNVRVADWSSGLLSTQLLMKSDRLELDSSMFNKWIYIPFTKDGESEFVKAGSRLWAGLEYSNWHTDDAVRRDKGIGLGASRQSPYHEFMAIGIGRANQWNRLFSRNLMIRLHLKNSAGTSIQDAYRSDSFSLSQNYPNPFTDQTGINYSLDREANVRLEITDLTGQVVLMKDEGMRPVGSHRLEIQNPGLAPGIYFYTLYARQNRETKKMVIMEKY